MPSANLWRAAASGSMALHAPPAMPRRMRMPPTPSVMPRSVRTCSRPGGGITAEDVAVPPVGHDETVIPVGLYFRAQTVDGPGQMPHAHVVYFPLQVPAHDGIRRAVHLPGGNRRRLQGGAVQVKDGRSRRGIADEGQPEVFMKGYGGRSASQAAVEPACRRAL